MTQEKSSRSLFTVPSDLEVRVKRSKSLLAQSVHGGQGCSLLNFVMAKKGISVLQTLVTTPPPRVALLIAGDMGCRGYEIGTVEHCHAVELTFLSILVSHEVVDTPITSRRVVMGPL